MQGARITVHLELDGEELLALLSYIALGLNFHTRILVKEDFFPPMKLASI